MTGKLGAGLCGKHMQPISFPQDMRESVITPGQVFMASVPMLVTFIIVVFLVMFGIFSGMAFYKYGLNPVLEHFRPLVADFLSRQWIVPPFLVLVVLAVYRQAARQKVIGIPTAFGYDRDRVYFHNLHASLAYRWEFFTSWRETRHFFLLHDGTRRIMWPKSLWSTDELAGQRALMREKITPKRMTRP